jgi:hypothetical protein
MGDFASFRDFPEIKGAFRNMDSTIRTRAKEVFELQRECHQTKFDYQMAVRGILTPEQLLAWCSSREGCVARGWMREP